MQRFNGTSVVLETNAALPGATVAVYASGTLIPSVIYEDDGVTPLANPFTSDAVSGLFGFYAADGTYDITISKTGATTYTIPAVTLIATAAGLNQLTGDVTAGPGTGAQVATIAAGAILLSGAKVTGVLPSANQASQAGRLIGVQVITATGAGTYTPTPGTGSIVIELVGGGGGSSGVASAAASQVNLGGGGGGSGYLRKRLTSAFSGAAYVVGAGGAGGASGNNNGVAGTSTTFTQTGGGTVYTAGGGSAGIPRTSFAPPITTVNGTNGAGGTATNGDLNIPGSVGINGNAPNAFVGTAGGGGASHLSPPTRPTDVASGASTAGVAGALYGAGASGAVSCNSGGAQAGAAGGNGVIIIWEYADAV